MEELAAVGSLLLDLQCPHHKVNVPPAEVEAEELAAASAGLLLRWRERGS